MQGPPCQQAAATILLSVCCVVTTLKLRGSAHKRNYVRSNTKEEEKDA